MSEDMSPVLFDQPSPPNAARPAREPAASLSILLAISIPVYPGSPGDLVDYFFQAWMPCFIQSGIGAPFR